MKHLLPLLSVLALAACGGPGSSAPSLPTAAPSVAPSASVSPGATAPPTIAPTASPSPSPTPVPLSLRSIGGAPLTATLSQLKIGRRTQAQGVTNGLPILVESSGMVAAWAGDQAVWVTNAQTNTDIPETGGTITPSGNLPISNPGFTPLSCLGSISAVCIVHPTGWTFGTASTNGKIVGKQTLTVGFADGTSAQTNDYVYDGWNLPCNSGWAYVGGVPVAQTIRATSDVYADCGASNIVFPRGGILYSIPIQDRYGNTATIMPTITAAVLLSSSIANVPMASIAPGMVYGIATQDGGFAKIYFTGPAGSGALNADNGMSLHSNPDGTYPF